MVSRIGSSFNQSSSFNRYEKKQQNQNNDSDSNHKKKKPEQHPLEEGHEEVPILYSATLLNISDPQTENLSAEGKVKHIFTENKHAEKQAKAIKALMSSFEKIKESKKKADIASMITSATKQLVSSTVQIELCKALETLISQREAKVSMKAYLGLINIVEHNSNAARLLKNKAIYLETVQELNTAQRRLFHVLSNHTPQLKKKWNIIKRTH